MYLIRHAKAIREIYLTNKDKGLTIEGKKQTKEKAKELRKLKIKMIITSPFRRALETASLLSKYLEVPFHIDKRFREYSYGKAEGKTFEEIRKQYNIKISEGLFFAEEALRIHN